MSILTRQLSRLKGATQIISRCLSTNTSPTISSAIIPIASIKMGAHNNWIYRQPDAIKTPLGQIAPIRLPNDLFWVPAIEKCPVEKIEAPTTEGNLHEKRAERLIVIRRKKMKKHKLRKLRKRMKYEWAKIRQKRELKKEKDFQAGLIAQYKKAEAFSAEKYVEERLEKLHEVIVPKYWKGRRMAEFLIRERMGLPPKGST